ncbi:hypothetical protein ZIOFF_046367 [Zingiber officinale]|uniref:Uncharacterized protein n=1 Tax=Zingiber officinale TaxID=94328 RepID=A0A8J5G037_ZINOF|nr:hypothetical protein ZIOFF_046367 [Zingiber officinale]
MPPSVSMAEFAGPTRRSGVHRVVHRGVSASFSGTTRNDSVRSQRRRQLAMGQMDVPDHPLFQNRPAFSAYVALDVLHFAPVAEAAGLVPVAFPLGPTMASSRNTMCSAVLRRSSSTPTPPWHPGTIPSSFLSFLTTQCWAELFFLGRTLEALPAIEEILAKGVEHEDKPLALERVEGRWRQRPLEVVTARGGDGLVRALRERGRSPTQVLAEVLKREVTHEPSWQWLVEVVAKIDKQRGRQRVPTGGGLVVGGRERERESEREGTHAVGEIVSDVLHVNADSFSPSPHPSPLMNVTASGIPSPCAVSLLPHTCKTPETISPTTRVAPSLSLSYDQATASGARKSQKREGFGMAGSNTGGGVKVQNLLVQMQNRFQAMSEGILLKNILNFVPLFDFNTLDEMGSKIDELEQSINDLKAEIGVEDAAKPKPQEDKLSHDAA